MRLALIPCETVAGASTLYELFEFVSNRENDSLYETGNRPDGCVWLLGHNMNPFVDQQYESSAHLVQLDGTNMVGGMYFGCLDHERPQIGTCKSLQH